MATHLKPLDDDRHAAAAVRTPVSFVPNHADGVHSEPNPYPQHQYSRPKHASFFEPSPAPSRVRPSSPLQRSTMSHEPSELSPNERSIDLPCYLCAAAWAGCAEAQKHLELLLNRLVLAQYIALAPAGSVTSLPRRELSHEVVNYFIHLRGDLRHFSDLQARAALRESLYRVVVEFIKNQQSASLGHPSSLCSEALSFAEPMSLSSEHEEVLRLYEIERLTYQQIAQKLGVSMGTIKSRLYRARRSRERMG